MNSLTKRMGSLVVALLITQSSFACDPLPNTTGGCDNWPEKHSDEKAIAAAITISAIAAIGLLIYMNRNDEMPESAQ